MKIFAEEKAGRRVVVVSFLAMLIVFGIRLSFSVFFAEFRSHERWSSEAAASIYSLNMLAFGVMPIHKKTFHGKIRQERVPHD